MKFDSEETKRFFLESMQRLEILHVSVDEKTILSMEDIIEFVNTIEQNQKLSQ